MLGIERESEPHVSFKARQRARTFLFVAGPGRARSPSQAPLFPEMVYRRRVGDIGDFGGGDLFIESSWFLSGALDPPGFVVNMRADFDEVFPFHSNFGGGFWFQLAAARGIG
jgi:hypothetical protein